MSCLFRLVLSLPVFATLGARIGTSREKTLTSDSVFPYNGIGRLAPAGRTAVPLPLAASSSEEKGIVQRGTMDTLPPRILDFFQSIDDAANRSERTVRKRNGSMPTIDIVRCFGLPTLPNEFYPEGTLIFESSSRRFYTSRGWEWISVGQEEKLESKHSQKSRRGRSKLPRAKPGELKSYCQSAGIGQEELANELRVSVSTISRIMSGKTGASDLTRNSICRVLLERGTSCRPEDLFDLQK